eukprot:TRINITY_DN34720_c0_g1_i1.p1 TRINITY_DN34720_c0_g1~~TRINITY_DN34720_c0_g1_i1.p1  ORF type:complete len:817 (+),score=111.47 TRINITY_DN34720_c0_g1_i1:78-2528(+)
MAAKFDQRMALRSLRPSLSKVASRFIVVGRREVGEDALSSKAASWSRSGRGKLERVSRSEFWVADETASVTLELLERWADLDESVLVPGEIFELLGGRTIMSAGRLHLAIDDASSLHRVGFLNMICELVPDVSSQPWADLKKTFGEMDAETPLAPSLEDEHRGHGKGQSKGQIAEGINRDSFHAKTNSRRSCFLCEATDHDVHSCPRADCGVVFQCSVLDGLENSPARRKALEAALLEAALPAADHYRWFKRERDGSMYLLFKTPKCAKRVLDAVADIVISGVPVRAFRISSPGKPKQNHQQKEKHDYSAEQTRFWRQSVCIDGVEDTDREALEWSLSEFGIILVSTNWHLGRCHARLGTSRQAKRAIHLSQNERISVGGSILRIEAFVGQDDVSRAPPAARASTRSSCEWCGLTGHDPSTCTQQCCWVYTHRSSCSQEDETSLEKRISAHSAVVQDFYWDEGRCYMRLEDAATADRVCEECNGLGELKLYRASDDVREPGADDGKNLVDAGSEERHGGKRRSSNAIASSIPPSRKKRHIEKSTPQNMQRKVCFLCGEADHELPECPVRQRCVIACRDWGTASNGPHNAVPAEVQQGLPKILQQELKLSVLRTYWHKGVCYIQLGSEGEAKSLLNALGSRGQLPVGDEVLRLREARSTRKVGGAIFRDTTGFGKGSRRGLTPLCKAGGGPDDDAVATDDGTSACGTAKQDCPLCGTGAGHDLRSCPDASRSVVVRGTMVASAPDQGESEVMAAALSAGIATPLRVVKQRASLFVVLANEATASALAASAAGEGFEVGGEPASIENVAQTNSKKRRQ